MPPAAPGPSNIGRSILPTCWKVRRRNDMAGNPDIFSAGNRQIPKPPRRLADETTVNSVAPIEAKRFQYKHISKDLFQVTIEDQVTIVELALPTSMDSDEFDELNDSLLKLIGQQPAGRWVLDLSRLYYLGSAALGLMVNLRQIVKDAGGM